MMKKSLIWLALGILAGCATEGPALPSWEIPEATETATEPLLLPALPALGVSGGVATLDRAGVLALTRYREAAEANTNIAGENAAALEAQSRAYNELIEAGKLQASVAAIREEQLKIARRQALVDRLTLRSALLLGLALAF